MIRTARSYTSLAAAGALILGGAAVASAAPGMSLNLASSDTPDEVEEEDDAGDLEFDLFEEVTDTPSDGGEGGDGEGGDDEGGNDDDGEENDGPQSDADDGEPSAFGAWVQSIPSEWGCVKGRIISANAAGDKTDFEGPQFASIEDAVGELGLEGRCVDVALARNGVELEDDTTEDDGEVGTAEAPAERAGPPANPGPPADRGPEQRGSSGGGDARGDTGPPANPGPPADRGPQQRGASGDGDAGPSGDRGPAGPPAGRGGR